MNIPCQETIYMYMFIFDPTDWFVSVTRGAGFPGLETGLMHPLYGPQSWGMNSWPMGLRKVSSGCPLRTSWSKYGYAQLQNEWAAILEAI